MWFYEENGMLYRHWQPLVEREGLAFEQLVLPVVVRRTIMTVAHEIPLAGHMGKKRRCSASTTAVLLAVSLS